MYWFLFCFQFLNMAYITPSDFFFTNGDNVLRFDLMSMGIRSKVLLLAPSSGGGGNENFSHPSLAIVSP